MDQLLSPVFWSIGLAEHIRNAVLVILTAMLLRLVVKVRLPHPDGASVVVVKAMAVVLVALTATGYSPLIGRVWYDAPMGACIAGVFYASTAFGPGVRLVALSPIVTITYAATVYAYLGMPVSEIAFGIMVCYSIFMVFSANLLMVAILLSAIQFGAQKEA